MNSRFYIYEAYKDEDAVAFHKTTPHYKTCVAKLESLMTGRVKTSVQWFDAVRRIYQFYLQLG